MTEAIREAEGGEAGFPVMPSVGAQLKAAREGRGMSLSDVAQVLKLGLRQVEALENGDWQGLPGNTFIRGFVRNYARLVQVDGGPLMDQLAEVLEAPKPQLDMPEAAPATMPMAGQGQRKDYAVALFGLGLVAVAVAIYFLMPGGVADLQASFKSVADLFAKQEAQPAPAAGPEPVLPPGATPQQVLNPQAVSVPEPTATGAAVAPVPVSMSGIAAQETPLAVPVAAGPVAAPSVATPVLRLVFQKESWVEVRDRSEKVVFSQKGAPGAEQVIEGNPPFSLVVGYAPGVRVLLRGQAVDLTPHSRGDVARLTLD